MAGAALQCGMGHCGGSITECQGLHTCVRIESMLMYLCMSVMHVESNCARSKVIAKCCIGMYCMTLNFQGALFSQILRMGLQQQNCDPRKLLGYLEDVIIRRCVYE